MNEEMNNNDIEKRDELSPSSKVNLDASARNSVPFKTQNVIANLNLDGNQFEKLLSDEGWQLRMKTAISHLPEDVPSMAWRSQLNERIAAEAQSRTRKRSKWLILSPALGFACAASLGLVLFIHSHSIKAISSGNQGLNIAVGSTSGSTTGSTEIDSSDTASIEQSMLSDYSQAEDSRDVTGTGLTPHEVRDESLDPDQSSTTL